MSKRKSDVTTGILSQLNISRRVPERLQRLYFQVLSDFHYQTAPPDEQILIDLIGWTYCKMIDVGDSERLYGVRMDLPRTGEPVNTMQERREKQAELELIPALQKQLREYIDSLRSSRKMSSGAGASDLERALQTLVRN